MSLTPNRLLISWIARSNDFKVGVNDKPNRGTLVNPQGPTMQFHQHFWETGAYHHHFLLYGSADHKPLAEKLAGAAAERFAGHRIEPVFLEIRDVIDLREVKGKVEAWLLENIAPLGVPCDLYFSPGTSVMQLAWFLCHHTLGLRSRLVQTVDGQYQADKKPLLRELTVEQSSVPVTAVLHQQTLSARLPETDYLFGPSLEPVYHRARLAAAADHLTVLIRGESGTGKEHLARTIHTASPRAAGPFEALNCAAMANDQLLESRLFGFAKGAFTGAEKDTRGLFSLCDGGTLFLDEIGDISTALQLTLLRVLESGEIQPVGGKTKRVNVRVVAATNAGLEARCRAGTFRWDLYYRLTVVELALPPLHARTKDERLALFDFFVQRQQSLLHKPTPLRLTRAAKALVLAYPFPGNVRELENLVAALYVFAPADGTVDTADLPARVRHPAPSTTDPLAGRTLEQVKAYAVQAEVKRQNGGRARAAAVLDIDVRVLGKYLEVEVEAAAAD